MQNQADIADTTDDQSRGSRWSSLLWFVTFLATGALLWWIGGGIPPLAWRQVEQALREHATSQPQFPLLLAQMAFLLAAWGVLLLLTVRVTARVFQQMTASLSQRPPIEQNLQAQPVRSEAVDAQETASGHIKPETVSASRSPQLTRGGGQSPLQKDHAPNSSLQVQAADVQLPSLAPPFQPALFGQPMQLAVGSCSVEGLQQEPSTTAYLLTESGSEKIASFSWPVALFALVDHIPRDEPGNTRSCHVIETMRDRVRHACTGPQPLSDDTLATLMAEQVQNVTRVIGQAEKANPAMAAVLVVGSRLYLANFGDTQVYLCCSQNGLYQITDVLEGGRLLAEYAHNSAHHSSKRHRRKQQGQRRDISLTRQDHLLALPLTSGDSVLICSDGLWSVLHTAYLEHLIRSARPDPSAMCAALVRAVRTSGSTDAVHLIVVHCQGS